jgi:hypothetical protein
MRFSFFLFADFMPHLNLTIRAHFRRPCDSNPPKCRKLASDQGDQIVRISAPWVIVFGKMQEKPTILGYLFPWLSFYVYKV